MDFSVQPVKRAFNSAVNWVADKVSSVCNSVSGWLDRAINTPTTAYAGYNSYTSGSSSYTGGTSYAAIQQRAEYVREAEKGQLNSGYGLSGEQLVRYQEQRFLVVKEAMERIVIGDDNFVWYTK